MTLITTLRQQYATDSNRLILFWPVALMLGIGGYFALENEPPLWLSAGMVGGAFLLLLLSLRFGFRMITIPLFLMAIGFADSHWRAHLVSTPLLTHELHSRMVEGVIDEVEPVENRIKLVISQPQIEDFPAALTPLRLRISFRDDGGTWQAGDKVRMMAMLYPLPQQTMPDSYDFARHFYFRRIGGNGFAMRPPTIIEHATHSRFSDWLGNLRHHIGEDMRAKMPGDVGTVAAAMTVGEGGPIPKETKEHLRDSGLAHMLAIAGLHLGIVAAIIFFTVRLILSFIERVALRYPIKKISAFVALLGALIYLMLAGYPIPATRAFVMVAVLFFGIMIDRQGFSLRTLSLAAGLILLTIPESMFGASFQMSFSATVAIISFTERFNGTFYRATNSIRGTIIHHAIGIACTSVVATLATAPFVLYNFNRFASFGLIANMIVIPLATFIIMPGIILSLMPLGLQSIGYLPLKFGVKLMISMAAWVTSLPYASLHLPAPTDIGLILSAFGLLWLCLMQERWRVGGIPVMILGLATMTLHSPPDMLISNDARHVMARLGDGHYTMLRGSGRSFIVQSWLRAEGEDDLIPANESGVDCDEDRCSYEKNGHHITVVKAPWDSDSAKVACTEKSDVLIAWNYLHEESCSGPHRLIGREELETYGAHEIWLKGDGVKVAYTRKHTGMRLWQVPEEE